MSKMTSEFITQITLRINENPPRIEQCLGELTEDETWYRPNESLNSVGNLILHLCGNIRQYAITTLSGIPDNRVRNSEFSTKGTLNKAQLIDLLQITVQEAIQSSRNLSEEQLMHTYEVQSFSLSGMGILVHVAEHFSYHTGQIAFLTKLLKNKDLKFYDDSTL